MKRSVRKPRNYKFLERYNWYMPGVADMFILLAFLLLGVFLGSIVTFVINMTMPGIGIDSLMLISYPLQFLPAMIYAGYKSGSASFNRDGAKLDSNNYKPHSGLVCAIIVILATLAGGFCADAISSLLGDMPEKLKTLLESMTTGKLWINFLCVSIFAPFFEEWLCRGMILRGLLHNKVKPGWAIVWSALFFAVIHMNPWQAVPAFLIGCLLGYVYYRTGSLKLTMLMHFTNNTFALVCSHIPALKDIDNWRDVLSPAHYWCILVSCVAIVLLTILTLRRIPLHSPQGNCDKVPSLFE